MKHLLILFIGLSTLTFTSCSSGASEKVADEFHQKLDEGDTKYIVDNLADSESGVSEDEWQDFLDLVVGWGPQTERTKKTGFSAKTNNGITTMKLSYSFQVEEYGLIHERLVLVDRGEGYKIMIAMMNSDESVVENGTSEY
ncbi:MAG: hypothetical protein GQ574_07735 [Crocinitomix sp.]|nr:hypothetical protein [Crocinitomix sp.]